ncbi:MAG TPA: alpha/beta hydrolase, partial [Pilimelia sp.]|nr:alpha/beta hydrolase [Pilimelia sp.]
GPVSRPVPPPLEPPGGAGPRRIDVGGVQLACRTWGPPGAPPAVLLHSGSSDGSTWASLAGDLAGRWRCIAPDLRGHGGSDWPAEYSLELMRDDVAALADALDLDRFAVVGHSLGAVVGYLIAQAHPGRVTHLVLEEPPPPVPLAMRLPPRPAGPLAFDWAAREVIVGQLNAPDPAWWERLASVTAPTLVVAGGPASHLPQEEIARMAARLPAGRLVTIDAGHAVHATRPAEFAAAVRGFLALPAGPG